MSRLLTNAVGPRSEPATGTDSGGTLIQMTDGGPVAAPDLAGPRPAPTASARANSRAALIEAAFEEFSTKGYESATVAGIAERAGVTTGALYAHFKGKLDLLLEVLDMSTPEDVMHSVAGLRGQPWAETAQLLGAGMATAPDRRTLLLLDVIVVARRDPHVAEILRKRPRGLPRCDPPSHRCRDRPRAGGPCARVRRPRPLPVARVAGDGGLRGSRGVPTVRGGLPTDRRAGAPDGRSGPRRRPARHAAGCAGRAITVDRYSCLYSVITRVRDTCIKIGERVVWPML